MSLWVWLAERQLQRKVSGMKKRINEILNCHYKLKETLKDISKAVWITWEFGLFFFKFGYNFEGNAKDNRYERLGGLSSHVLDNLPCIFLYVHHCAASPFKQNGEYLAGMTRSISLSLELSSRVLLCSQLSVRCYLYSCMPGRVSWLNLISLQTFCPLKPFINHISFKRPFICILWRAITVNLELKTRTNANPV